MGAESGFVLQSHDFFFLFFSLILMQSMQQLRDDAALPVMNISRAVKNRLNDLNEHLNFAMFDITGFASSMLPSADDKKSQHISFYLEDKKKMCVIIVIIVCGLRTVASSFHTVSF